MEGAAYLSQFFDVMVRCGLATPEQREPWMAKALDGNCELWPVRRGGEFMGGVFFHGCDVHIAIEPAWHGRWITLSHLKAFATWTHEQPLRAAIKSDNPRAITLARRLGFRFDQDQGIYHLYVKDATHAQPQ